MLHDSTVRAAEARQPRPRRDRPAGRLYKMATVVLVAALTLSLPGADKRVEVTREVYLMGTRCTLTTFGEDRQAGLVQIEKQLQILEDAENQLSTWRPNSILGRLNRHPPGAPFDAPPFLCGLFRELAYWVSETGGTFDPAIGSLERAWGLREGGRVPTQEELKWALGESGFSFFNIEGSSCRIERKTSVSIDCGGFGKGEALDRLLTHSSTHASLPWLVDLGGQITVSGHPPGSSSWKVDLAHPLERRRPVMSLNIDRGSLSASGGSERDLEVAGRRVGHILDPRSGFPAGFRGSVTVWHERALVADILSTALYVMGPDEGRAWAETRNIAACFFVPAPDDSNQEAIQILATRAFARRFFKE